MKNTTQNGPLSDTQKDTTIHTPAYADATGNSRIHNNNLKSFILQLKTQIHLESTFVHALVNNNDHGLHFFQ